MRIIVVLIWFVFFIPTVLSQDKVQILDKDTKMPLVNASVLLRRNNSVTVTDNKGFFYLKNLPSITDTDTLHFSYIGYIPCNLSFKDIVLQNYVIHLTPETQMLGQVTVTVDKLELASTIPFKELSGLKDGLFSFGAVLIDNKIYVIGGDNTIKEKRVSPTQEPFKWEHNSNKLQIYDIDNDNWTISNRKFISRA